MQENNREINGVAEGHEALRPELDQLRVELDACRHDLRQAHVELAQAREIQEMLEEQLRTGDGVAYKTTVSSDIPRVSGAQVRHVTWPRKMWRRVTMSASERALQRDIQLLHESELFDPDWYQVEYPDVARSGMEPAEHYLRYGMHEGRDPGPLFSTDTYRRDHPEAVENGINPLVHFLRSGTGASA